LAKKINAENGSYNAVTPSLRNLFLTVWLGIETYYLYSVTE